MRRLIAVASLVMCCGVAAASADPITVDYTDATGNIWGNLTETAGFSWNEVDAICPNDGVTPCSGSLNSTDFTGWIWATQDQVNNLFREVTGLTSELDDFVHSEFDSVWAPEILALFTPVLTATHNSLQEAWVWGLTATAHESIGSLAYSASITNVHMAGGLDSVIANTMDAKTLVDPTLGVWLYQAPAVSAVPEPGTLSLVSIVLALSARRLHRRRPSRALRDERQSPDGTETAARLPK